MNGYYERQFNDNGLLRMGTSGGEEDMMGVIEGVDMSSSGIVGGHSLDDIVSQNAKEMRRQTMPYGSEPSTIDTDMRRISMMDFTGSSPGGPLENFTFEPTSAPNMDSIIRHSAPIRRHNSTPHRRPAPLAAEVPLNTQFAGSGTTYNGIAAPGPAYGASLAMTSPLDMDMASQYVASNMPMPLDLTDSTMSGMMNDASMSIYSRQQFTSPTMASPMHQAFPSALAAPPPDMRTGSMEPKEFTSPTRQKPLEEIQDSRSQGLQQSMQPQPLALQRSVASQSPTNQMSNLVMNQEPQYQSEQPSGAGRGTLAQQQPVDSSISNISEPNSKWRQTTEKGTFPSHLNKAQVESQFKNAYSSTGFDMLGVLMRVATRPNPEINIGSVDLSCAFVVCDAAKDDIPIVYCSENFERLTGYNRHMILGRNCRFLQSPDGKVDVGVKRKYVDDESVLYLKNMVALQREAQISLINYRRGGQPFMNLLTMIPVKWDTDEIKYFVGFQVDLVEQPNSVTNRNPDGSYSINYQRGVALPRYIFNTAEAPPQVDLGQTIPRDDVSTVLSTFGSGESDLSKRIWDKLLLENTDDVVHVLSLKGLFLYLSPSSRKVLEYEASELVGRALSSVCHPSDIVPVTRELRETSTGSSVNVVFRIRRKESGYMWFEGHGSLHTEQGKGRKCIILVGRERPVYALNQSDIHAAGGIGDNELWSKMSTAGMFLFVASNVRQLLDRTPEELVGTSIQALMRQDSKVEFSRILEICRTGKKASLKHEMINKRGQVLQAFTTIHPGDAVEGQKPTFMVAQTRMLKQTRGGTPRPSMYMKQERESSNSLTSGGSGQSTNGGRGQSSESTPKTSQSGQQQYVSTEGIAPTYSGHNGLALGHQDDSLASDENVFDELKTTRSTSWQYELRQMEKRNRLLVEEVQSLLAAKKKRKRRKGAGQMQKDCANCHTRVTPEWRRGPSGNRDLCNSCGLRWAKQNGRMSPRTPSQPSVHSPQSDKASKASVSPRITTQTILPNQTAEASGQSSIPSTIVGTDQKASGLQANSDSHAAKVARMEVGASQGLAGGVPPKIDEVVEPD